jgi:tripartite-type tricarboxylate transporter receptor subunit TctC
MLAVTTSQRLPALKDVPTMAEAGVPDFRSDTWNAIAAPPHTPAPIIARVNAAMDEILRADDIKAQLERLGLQPVGGSPAEMAAFLQRKRAAGAK